MAAIEYVTTGRLVEPVPEQAIVIYRTGTSWLATHHEVSKRGKGFVLGHARALSARTLNGIIEAAQRSPAEFALIPDHLLYQQNGVMAWFRPAMKRRVWFRRSNDQTAMDVAMPPLVYKTDGKALSVVAVATSGRPQADTPLFHAPIANVHSDTVLCLGNADLPDTNDAAAIPAWESALWDTNFSVFHQPFLNRKGKRSTSFTDYKSLMSHHRSAALRWTSRRLLPLSMTLKEWINESH